MIFIPEKNYRIYIFSIVFAYIIYIFYSVFNAFTLDINMVDLLISFKIFLKHSINEDFLDYTLYKHLLSSIL